MTLKDTVEEAMEMYMRHADFEKRRAEQATKGSSIQNELLRAYSFNKGRAKAMEEVLKMIEETVG